MIPAVASTAPKAQTHRRFALRIFFTNPPRSYLIASLLARSRRWRALAPSSLVHFRRYARGQDCVLHLFAQAATVGCDQLVIGYFRSPCRQRRLPLNFLIT